MYELLKRCEAFNNALCKKRSLVFDSTKLSKEQMKAVETALYGDESEAPKLPTPDEFKALIQAAVS